MLYLSLFLSVICILGAVAVVYGVEQGSSEVTGDLDAHAPFGIPPDDFKDLTSKPNASASYSIFGYNVSAPAGQDPAGNGNAIDGWKLSAAVTGDVPLTDAGDLPDSDKSKVTDATVLSLSPPSGVEVDKSWKLCAVVYPGLAGTAAQSTAGLNGTCEAVLHSDCIKQLQVYASVSGVTKDGNCSSPGVPVKCQDQFPSGANGTAFALNSSVISANRFYAFGAPPLSSGNSTALEEAVENIWPVLITWGHLADNGDFAARNSYLQCVHAANGTSTGGGGSGGATPSESAPSATPTNVGTSIMGRGSRRALAIAAVMALWLWG